MLGRKAVGKRLLRDFLTIDQIPEATGMSEPQRESGSSVKPHRLGIGVPHRPQHQRTPIVMSRECWRSPEAAAPSAPQPLLLSRCFCPVQNVTQKAISQQHAQPAGNKSQLPAVTWSPGSQIGGKKTGKHRNLAQKQSVRRVAVNSEALIRGKSKGKICPNLVICLPLKLLILDQYK